MERHIEESEKRSVLHAKKCEKLQVSVYEVHLVYIIGEDVFFMPAFFILIKICMKHEELEAVKIVFMLEQKSY